MRQGSSQKKTRKDCFRPGHLLGGRGRGRRSIMLVTSSSFGGGKGDGPVIDDLIGADQEIPDWLSTITFLGKGTTVVVRSVSRGFSTGDVIWGLGVSLLTGGVCFFPDFLVMLTEAACGHDERKTGDRGIQVGS